MQMRIWPSTYTFTALSRWLLLPSGLLVLSERCLSVQKPDPYPVLSSPVKTPHQGPLLTDAALILPQPAGLRRSRLAPSFSYFVPRKAGPPFQGDHGRSPGKKKS